MLKQESNFLRFTVEPQDQRAAKCDKHGDYISKSIFSHCWSACPECWKEAGAREMEQQARRLAVENAERLAAYNAQKLAGAKHAANIGGRFLGCTLDNFNIGNDEHTAERLAAVNWARAFLAGFDEVMQTGRGGIFCGNYGTGKNHIAAAICLALIERGRGALITTCGQMFRRVKSTYSPDNSEKEEDVIKQYAAPDLLVLDEFGVSTKTETERRIFFDVINLRYEEMKPTIIITNLTRAQFVQQCEPRALDRLLDNGGRFVFFNWESYRGRMEDA